MRRTITQLALACLALVSCLAQEARAQTSPFLAVVVPSCGSLSAPLVPNEPHMGYMDQRGNFCTFPGATGAFSVSRTTGIGTTGVQVSAADLVNRRTLRNVGSVACEIMPGAAAYGTGHPLQAGESFTFDSAGRTTAAIYVACASPGGVVSVISY